MTKQTRSIPYFWCSGSLYKYHHVISNGYINSLVYDFNIFIAELVVIR